MKKNFTDIADSGIWAYSNLSVDDKGFVNGSAHTFIKGKYSIQISVTSYKFIHRGKETINHVPHIVVTNNTGSIVAEPNARDSINPSRAITNAIRTAEMVWKNLEDYV